MVIIVTLKEHLERLKAVEVLMPEKEGRKEVPSMDRLAEKIGVHRGTLNRIANNHGKSLKLDVLNSIIETLQDLGFETDLSDVLAYQRAKK